MKKNIIIAIILIILFGIGALVYAGSDSVPGSYEDPVVTRSYVEALVTFSPIELMEGQRLIGGEGTEIILRSGEATAIDNGYNGVSNLTTGMDLMTGHYVSVNNLLLVPRNDGRGIVAVSEVWVLVRGSFTIE